MYNGVGIKFKEDKRPHGNKQSGYDIEYVFHVLSYFKNQIEKYCFTELTDVLAHLTI
jgi:hypothetical protein